MQLFFQFAECKGLKFLKGQKTTFPPNTESATSLRVLNLDLKRLKIACPSPFHDIFAMRAQPRNFIYLFDCFYVRPSDFCSLFKVRRHVIGCINRDIVISLCSELLMMLSYYIHLRFGINLLSHRGIEHGSSRT